MRSFNTGRRKRRAGLRTALMASAIGLAVLGLSACGGSGSTLRTASTHSAPASGGATAEPVTTWADQAQQLCSAKHAAIQALGYVHITYGGIERVGLPAAARVLDRYLARLVGVLDLRTTAATPHPTRLGRRIGGFRAQA
jgi:hypothetical protein